MRSEKGCESLSMSALHMLAPNQLAFPFDFQMKWKMLAESTSPVNDRRDDIANVTLTEALGTSTASAVSVPDFHHW